MKKMIVTLLIIFFIISIILLNYQNFTTIYTIAADAININNTSIPYNILKQYKSNNLVKKKEAEDEIKKICLSTLEYPNWQNYIDYIDLKIYTGNVLPQPGNELIVALNLSKDLASVCIFVDNGQSYDVYEKIENLLPIEIIDFLKIPDKEYDFLVIYQIADERLGAFYYENFLEIYMYNNKIFEKKLKETIFYEEIYKSIWIDETAPKNEWNKNTIKNTILFIENSNLSIDISGTKNKYSASGFNTIPKSSDFKLIDSSSYKYKYYWNKELEKFSRNEDIISFNSIPTLIVGDSETDYKNLCGFSKNKYKLLTSSGKMFYIDKELINENKGD